MTEAYGCMKTCIKKIIFFLFALKLLVSSFPELCLFSEDTAVVLFSWITVAKC